MVTVSTHRSLFNKSIDCRVALNTMARGQFLSDQMTQIDHIAEHQVIFQIQKGKTLKTSSMLNKEPMPTTRSNTFSELNCPSLTASNSLSTCSVTLSLSVFISVSSPTNPSPLEVVGKSILKSKSRQTQAPYI